MQLKKLVENSCNELRPLAEKNNQKLQFYPGTKRQCETEADPEMIRHAIDNYISNAIKYTPEGGNILVRVENSPDNKSIRCSVEDNGLGIPAEDQKNIFGQFFRASNAKSSEIEGTGLGLNITKKFIEMHDGQVGFESKENEGSAFWFEIPIVKPSDKKDE